MQAEKIVADEDLAKVVEAIFAIGTPLVHESYSAFGSEILSFHNHQELLAFIQRKKEKEKVLLFSVYYPETEGFVEKGLINLDPKKCDGHRFRYRISGWGLIGFQLQNMKTSGVKCSIGVNTELRANKWFDSYPELKSPSLWQWKLVEKHARRLIRVLKNYAQQ